MDAKEIIKRVKRIELKSKRKASNLFMGEYHSSFKGRGMIFYGTEMNFSALPFTPHEIENAQHPYELPQVHYTVIKASMMQMGIAGDDSWGARTHKEYLLPVEEKLVFEFCMKGI